MNDGNPDIRAYADNRDYLLNELRWLDALIRFRATTLDLLNSGTATDAQASRTIYITPGEAEWQLDRSEAAGSHDPVAASMRATLESLRDGIDRRVELSCAAGVVLGLPRLRRLFRLSAFEERAVLICMAPELRRKYDRLYAYLQDDITRKKPSVDLVLDLLCDSETERWSARSLFFEDAPLIKTGIVHKLEDPQSPSGSSELAQFLRLDPRIVATLLGQDGIDARLKLLVTLFRPTPADGFVAASDTMGLLAFLTRHFGDDAEGAKRVVLYLHGPYGAGKRNLACGACQGLGRAMLGVDVDALLAAGPEGRALLKLVFLEARLQEAAVYLENANRLLKPENKATLKLLSAAVAEFGWLVFLAGDTSWMPERVFENCLFYAVGLGVPDVPLRQAAWENALRGHAAEAAAWAGQLARSFRLTPGQISDSAAVAVGAAMVRGGTAELSLASLYEACRRRSSHKMGELAVKVEPRYAWEDLILPDDKTAHLREICSNVRHRYRVFGEWGFDKKLAHGTGLSALFFGAPGTGKTMAAQVIAREVELDLYKIDLSGVISKYIGETEKNLAKIFEEAEASNAILFFDEADALFGKRTEISDAHDRYANIETSYLLQRIEEYEGVVILATNLRENMDDAFLRRIGFLIEFPFPDEAGRLRLWRRHVPDEAPVSESVDFEYLSRELKIAGGSIKNIVINSAFLAAENGGIIDMTHLLSGARREFEKLGKLWHGADRVAPRRLQG